MRLYRNLSQAVIQGLQSVFTDNKYADKVIEKILKSDPKWGARDRRFIAETIYDIVRWYRLFRESSGTGTNDYWKLLGVWCIWKKIELPAWEEFKGLNRKQIESNFITLQQTRKIRESIPDWLDELGEKELGEEWDKEIAALNEEAQVVLRVNTLKISREELHDQLMEGKVDTIIPKQFPDALILNQRQNVFTRQQFKEGLFEVQDAGSQLIAPFLKAEPGMRVIDACAGSGGKTLHLAAIMKNKGRIIAMDTEDWKLEELKKRARRAGASNIETRVIESSKTIKRLENSADRLLLDVPCSGLGVIKRNPDAKWKLSLDFINRIKDLQQKILSDYSIMVKPGGLMVYSTCSLLPSENVNQVDKFLRSNNQFELLEQKWARPSEGFDGFYIALIRRASL
jgi:16S rRNA (cytosine967-C5)-methyltransferase